MEKNSDKCEVFNWQEYLDLCKATDVPHTLFKHVEQSLDMGFSCGMAVEASFKTNDITNYWPAVITNICGPLITLKYVGSNENSKNSEIWSEINSLQYVGYSSDHGIDLCPPPCIRPLPDTLEDKNGIKNLLQNIPIVPKQVLDKGGKTAVDIINNGMIVGVRDALDPYVINKFEIALHVGGRLFLKRLNNSAEALWLFYTDFRIVAVDCDSCSQFPNDLIMTQPKIEPHTFELGMQLEMLNPKTRSSFHNGIVTKIIDKYYFIVSLADRKGEFDQLIDNDNSWLCTIDHPYIFPVGWAAKHNLRIKQSNEIDSERCTYKEMFSVKANASMNGFEVAMKLEAVHPHNPDFICAATIKSIHDHLLCITFDHEEQKQLKKNYYVYYNSNEIFPIYWCGTNNYELICPGNEPEPIMDLSSEENLGPIIYFNYKCRPGPMHSHKKISQLPKSVGPGDVSQVLKTVLNLIVSEAYQPLRILRMLEYEGEPPPGRTLVEIKASTYNNKKKVTVRANVDVVTKVEELADYCREVCKIIQACPYLFGPHDIGDNCPENCAGDKNGNVNDKGKHRRKRRKGLHFKTVHALARRAAANQSDHNNDSDSDSIRTSISRPNSPTSIASVETENASDMKNSSNDLIDDNLQNNGADMKGKKTRKRRSLSPHFQVYEMKTRGAKLPNFKLQMKQGHWDKKDVETIYKKTYRSNMPKKKPGYEYITETDSDSSESMAENAKLNNSDEKLKFNMGEQAYFNNAENFIEKEQTWDIEDGLQFEQDNSYEINNETEDDCESLPPNDETEMLIENEEDVPTISSAEEDEPITLTSNPLHWSVDTLYDFLKETDCSDLADVLKEELIDGQAFMMLNLPFVQKFLNLRLEAAIKLCKYVAKIKLSFFSTYGN